MRRTLQAELLDSLPPDHPDALHNRRDLRITNGIMGNHRWVERTLLRVLRPAERVLEIGAGTGELGRRLNAAGALVDALDLWPRPADWPAGRAWHVADLLTFPGYRDYDVVVGNLIFHQFSELELGQLGKRLGASARVMIACEPARRRLSQALFATVGPLLGANHVSRHDARVSIAAGFLGTELPDALGLHPDEWHRECSTSTLGANRCLATRR